MINLPSGTKIWLVAGITDMRNGFNGLGAKIQTALKDDPMSGHVFNRSDCSYLSDEQFNDAPQVVAALKTLDVFNGLTTDTAQKSAAFDSKKVTAHTAIIPTTNMPDLSRLTDKEKAVYLAIAQFYLAQFVAKKRYDEAIAEIKCGDEMFKVSARKTTDAGFTTFLNDAEEDDEEDENSTAFEVISSLQTGATLTCREVVISEKKTKPLPLFTEATLLAALVRVADFVADPRIKKLLKEKDKDKKDEHGGIGTPATLADQVVTGDDYRKPDMKKKGNTGENDGQHTRT